MDASDKKELRVILDNIDVLNDEWFDTFPTDEGQTCIHDSLEYEIVKANKILAKPPRNCDVGTAEEQGRRCRETFAAWRDKFPNDMLIEAIIKWAQMPYEAEKGGAK